MELGYEGRVDAVACLVVRPQIVSKRLDDVIGGDPDVGGSGLEHLCHGVEDAPHGAQRSRIAAGAPNPIEVTEELIGAVDQMDDHDTRFKIPSLRSLIDSSPSTFPKCSSWQQPRRRRIQET